MKQLTIKGFAYCKLAREWESDNSNYRDGFNYDFCHVELERRRFAEAERIQREYPLGVNHG